MRSTQRTCRWPSVRQPRVRRLASSVSRTVSKRGRQPANREGGRRPGAAMPGWKRDFGKRLDAFIVRTAQRAQGREAELAVLRHRGPGLVPVVPRPHPLRQGTFFRGTSLRPIRPAPARTGTCATSTSKKGDELDERQIATWVKQGATLPAGFLADRPEVDLRRSAEPQKQFEPFVDAGELARRNLSENAADAALVDRAEMIDQCARCLREPARSC